MVSAAFPVLLSVAFCTALVVPLTAEKVSDVGVSDATGAVIAVMSKVTEFEMPPPGEGLVTVTGTFATSATSPAGIIAVSCVPFT